MRSKLSNGLTLLQLLVFIVTLSVVLVWVLNRPFVTPRKPYVVVYTSQDQVYAEPILQEFTKQTGIKVRPVYDNEAVKTVGLVNRLIAEKDHPQCDVFWNNEELRTRQLAAQNLFRETNGWAAFGFRSRQLVINTNKLSLTEAPKSFLELTNSIWKGRVALAYPLFGTTATHFLALRQHLGPTGWEHWCAALAANKPLLVDGNSVVVKMVGSGEAVVGMTDSDDVYAGQREKLPIDSSLANDSLYIPNTVAVIRNAPHPEAAQKLFEHLQSANVGQMLVDAHALEGAQVPEEKRDVEISDELLRDFESSIAKLKEIFLR